jgi:hypothetical protein
MRIPKRGHRAARPDLPGRAAVRRLDDLAAVPDDERTVLERA